MSKLSSAQRLILTTAADRVDGAVLPLPEALARRGLTLMLKSLLGRGLIAARPAQDGEPAWSGGDDEQQQSLEITAAGRTLIEERQVLPQRQRGRRKPVVRRQPGRRRRARSSPRGSARAPSRRFCWRCCAGPRAPASALDGRAE